jgi:DNA-binding winged helix-turn-helix (wHTH) protein/tetratricopeptide (TPR) repeat protein
MDLPGNVRRYRFGLIEVDPVRGELLRQGVRVKLQEQPFRLLILLLERAGEIVGRDELRTRLWPEDTFVEFDNSLNVAVRKLREALRDDANEPRFIETVPRRGYRLLAPVSLPEEAQIPVVPAEPRDAAPFHTADTSRVTVAPASDQRRRSPTRRYSWAFAVVLLLAGVVGSRFYYLRRSHPVITAKDTIVVADFVNTTGEAVFDDSLKQGLDAGLHQSPFLNVVPRRAIEDILQQMGRAPDDRMTGHVAVEVCQRASSKVEVQGSIQNLGNNYLIGLAAIRCDNGDAVVNEQVQAKRKEDVIAALGKAATQLRARLGESLSSIQKNQVPLELATTPSLDALKTYNQALSTWDSKGNSASVPLFLKAIELDPNFATAYGALATVYHNLNESELAEKNTSKAYELRAHLPEAERLSAEARYHLYVTGDLYKAAQIYELRIQNNQNVPGSLANLGSIYTNMGRFDRAAEQLREVVRLAPTRSPAYVDLARILLALNRIDEAGTVLAEADKRELHTDQLLQLNFWRAFLLHDNAEMQRFLMQTSDVPGAEPLLLSAQANTEAYFGRLNRAHEISSLAAGLMVHEGAKESAANCLAEAAVREAEAGDSKQARDSLSRALKLAHNRDVVTLSALVMARTGDLSRAQVVTEQLDKLYPSDTMIQRYWLPTIRAELELQRGNPSKAVNILDAAAPLELAFPQTLSVPSLYPVYVRGQAYLAAGDGKVAGAEFQKIIDHPGMVLNFLLASLAHLGRARAYARAGDFASAHDAYEQFFSLWKDADAGIPVLVQAKQEDQRLVRAHAEQAKPQ